jgi:DNA-binding MarR family transcriptional regulator
MSTEKQVDIESIIFTFIDEFQFLLFPEKWKHVFMDYSKNEILALLIVYRRKSVTMTEVADYLHIPLNTATGIITRLEKKNIVMRNRDNDDKRIVKISLTEDGSEFVENEKSIITVYLLEIYSKLNDQEREVGINIVYKVMKVLMQKIEQKDSIKEVKKIRRIEIE